jgi:ribonuclease HI
MIPDDIEIAPDGQATRILGAWMGNELSGDTPWPAVIDKVEESLEKWERIHPPMELRRHILNMTVMGMTQFLTQVQGMPKHVEDHFKKRSVLFMWNGKRHHTVNEETLQAPKIAGGHKMPSIVDRNLAIDAIWWREFSKTGKDRQTWCFMADAIYARKVQGKSGKTIDRESLQCLLYQSWRPSEHPKAKLPPVLKNMAAAARKLRIRFDGRAISAKVKAELPLWFHVGTKDESQSQLNKPASRCLRKTHLVRTVGDALLIASHSGTNHSNRKNCGCKECRIDRFQKGCKNPKLCVAQAQKLLNDLYVKWDPRVPEQDDDLLLSPEEDQQTQNNAGHKDSSVCFDPDVRIHSLEEGLRILGERQAAPSREAARRLPQDASSVAVTAYTDGSFSHDEHGNRRAGAGVWYAQSDPRNIAVRLNNEPEPTNQSAEIDAILAFINSHNGSTPLDCHSDSKTTIQSLTKYLKSNERRGYIGVANADALRVTAAILQERGARTRFHKIKAHSGIPGNEGADKLAADGASKDFDTHNEISHTVTDGPFHLSGAILQGITQRTVYQGLLEDRKTPIRKRAADQLDIARWAVKDSVAEVQFRTSVRTPNLRTEQRVQFRSAFRFAKILAVQFTVQHNHGGSNWVRTSEPIGCRIGQKLGQNQEFSGSLREAYTSA